MFSFFFVLASLKTEDPVDSLYKPNPNQWLEGTLCLLRNDRVCGFLERKTKSEMSCSISHYLPIEPALFFKCCVLAYELVSFPQISDLGWCFAG